MAGKSINSRSKRKFTTKLPGGRLKTTEARRKPARIMCPVTGNPLNGVPRVRKTHKSNKAPNRPYGGVLSSRVVKKMYIQRAREENA